MSQKAVRILGIDPGLNHTGYGFVDFVPGHFTYIASGVLNVPSGELSDRLGFIFKSLSGLIEEHHPDVASIEKLFEYERPVQHAAVPRKGRCDVCCRMPRYRMQRDQHSRN